MSRGVECGSGSLLQYTQMRDTGMITPFPDVTAAWQQLSQ